jgi:hypothetical protein
MSVQELCRKLRGSTVECRHIKGAPTRTIVLGAFAAALGLAAFLPASADQVKVRVGADRGHAKVVVSERHRHNSCKMVLIHKGNVTEKIRRCG